MAKKGQPLQLQTEVNNDEEWEKLLQRHGLIVVDVYSEWCGPCSGMMATLKKLKLEMGGDVLQLAIAKADKITALQRFKNKSEPTWMFIVHGKMVNFMFGANAPKLSRLIIEELKKEKEARDGRRERVQMDIGELADEEREREEVKNNTERMAREKEIAKAEKDLLDRRTAEANQILESLNHLAVVLVFPHAKLHYQEAFGDLLGEAGLTITSTEKVNLTEAVLTELFFFGECPFTDESIEELLNATSVMLLVKPLAGRDLPEPTNEVLAEIVYGRERKPPGSPDCMAKVLSQILLKEAEEQEEENKNQPQHDPEHLSVWMPENDFIRATALRLFFPKITSPFLIAPPEPIPPHFSVVFDAYRRAEVHELMDKYPGEILRYGFFTSEAPEEAKLVAKSVKKYERSPDRAPEQKMVLQLARRRSECVLAFAQMKPNYMSPNTKEGKRECAIFFPDDYDEPPEEQEEEEEEEPPPQQKKKKQDVEGELEGNLESEVNEEIAEGDEEVAETPGEEVVPSEVAEGEIAEPSAEVAITEIEVPTE